MVRIDDRALAQGIVESGGLTDKAGNAQRLAKALTVSRRCASIQDVLIKLAPDQLKSVVHEASMVLRVKRNSQPTQDKIVRKRPPSVQQAFEKQLRHGAERRINIESDLSVALDGLPSNALARSLAATSDINVRADNWQDLHGGNANASAYNSGFWRVTVAAKEQIDAAPATTAEQLLVFLAQKRRDLAFAVEAPQANLFGIGNAHTVITCLNDKRYGQFPVLRPIVESVIRWSDEFEITGTRPTDMPGNIDILPRRAGEERLFKLSMRSSDGKKLPLSSYTMELDMEGQPLTWEDGTPKVTVNGASCWDEIKKEVEILYQKALAPLPGSFSDDQHVQIVGENVGRLHYLLAHNPQYRRGSAGVYDMLVAIIFLHQGYIFPGWKDKTAGDIQALGTLDPERYSNDYLQLMRHVPTKIG